MVVIRTYTFFRETLKILGEEERYTSQAEELRRGATAITEAVLYIKQHSVNCIPAAMYAMTCFDPRLFPPDEAERFTAFLFAEASVPGNEDAEEIRSYILSLYKKFIEQGEAAAGQDWKDPIFNFLNTLERCPK